ncbi:MAG: hypothetical protein RJB11_2129 [Planctomycetota bacterium]|jgi:hypothetical protein
MQLAVVGMATPTAARTLRGISFQFVRISQKHRPSGAGACAWGASPATDMPTRWA